MRQAERFLYFAIDTLAGTPATDAILRESVGLRGYGQKRPANRVYKSEGTNCSLDMMTNIRRKCGGTLCSSSNSGPAIRCKRRPSWFEAINLQTLEYGFRASPAPLNLFRKTHNHTRRDRPRLNYPTLGKRAYPHEFADVVTMPCPR